MYVARPSLPLPIFHLLTLHASLSPGYGLLAVHRFCFALGILHLLLSLLLIGVHDTKSKRASLQNGWWGPKVLVWMLLVFLSFLVPNEFFMAWGSYIGRSSAL